MLKLSLEGYPVGIKELEPQDLKSLQDHYLPLVLGKNNAGVLKTNCPASGLGCFKITTQENAGTLVVIWSCNC